MASQNYTAYEITAGACKEDVEGLCSQYTEEGSFNDVTQPKGTDVDRWLTLSRHWVAGLLAKCGYSPTQTVEEVLGILEELNALDCCVRIELSVPITGTGEPNERFMEFKARRDEIVAMIENSNMLSVLGATETEAGSLSENLIATGISKSRKRSVEDNDDLVQARFKRGMGRNLRAGDDYNSESDFYDRTVV